MAGLIGIYTFGLGRDRWKIARFIYYGLLALQHRGQEIASIITFDNDFHVITRKGLIENAFDEDTINSLSGFLGLGYLSSNENVNIVSSASSSLIIIGDGKPLLDDDNPWKAFGELLVEEISRTKDYLESGLKLINEVNGGYSFIALTEDQVMLAGKDSHGIKPLEIGSLGFDLGTIASESAALDVLGMEHAYSVKPGEVIKFDPYSIERKQSKINRPTYCSFEYVYLARHDSIINNIPVYIVRKQIGKVLADELLTKADVVIGIPETAIPFALGYSKASGIPVDLGFIMTGRHIRTAIKPSMLERMIGIQLKLNPIKSVINGKDIVLIDDSIVRGLTLRNTVWNLKRNGAKKIHIRVGSPPLKFSCPFGVEIPPSDELISCSLAENEIAEIIGADTFHFISVRGLIHAIGLLYNSLCLRCFKGEHP
ncbi:MAG: amidophosphoribosyltransferase [Thermoprotei archaeon]